MQHHAEPINEIFTKLKCTASGLTSAEAKARLKDFGRNVFPVAKPATVLQLFGRQFLSPLIYILLVAAAVSALLDDYTDAGFILIVLLINAIVGTIQEYGAEKSAHALRQLSQIKALVIRDEETVEINAEEIVLGDIVLLETGRKVPADIRLLKDNSLEIDESLLTGESLAVIKNSSLELNQNTSLGDRLNMAYKGSLVTKGRGRGVVVATALATELGKIAESLTFGESAKPPLLIRMELFTKKIALFLLGVTALIASYLLWLGQSWNEVMIFSVALAVSAIPEGLPIALTVALAMASRRMAKRNVIVRKLPAVEALGSCTFIATDKTGTLTVNQLTIQKIALPGMIGADVSGSGLTPKGTISRNALDNDVFKNQTMHLLSAGVLCNESDLINKNGEWVGHGDAVDLAFLVLALKANIQPEHIRSTHELISEIPFEPENQYAATLHQTGEDFQISVKGALEKILPMCSLMTSPNGPVAINASAILKQADALADAGYRVLALASSINKTSSAQIKNDLNNLVFLGCVGMIDPLRPEAATSIKLCRESGIEVAIVTGDHPKTALAIARELNLADSPNQVVSGPQLRLASEEEKIKLIFNARVFARVEPQQKLEIVQCLLKAGHYVAVTGDGANDAPALKAANVGVAMGKSGTDVAKETADLIITDDRFASIIAGVEEGRVAYANIRKVVYLLISTGAAEIFMFVLSLAFGAALPLTAVQLLWLNLVTNGIQDIGLAAEPAEGDELQHPPRKPNEPIFNRVMIERVVLSALVMSGVSFGLFYYLMNTGVSLEAARNLTLLLMVLFQNVMVGNCRSETKSAFKLNPLRNPLLLFGTIGAQLIHIVAMYTPGLKDVLGVSPVTLAQWGELFLMALSVLVVIELYKLFRRGSPGKEKTPRGDAGF